MTFRAAEPRHHEVHDHDAGLERLGRSDGVQPVRRVADDGYVAFVAQDGLHAGPHYGMVVGEASRNRHVPRRVGRSADAGSIWSMGVFRRK